MSKAFEDLRSVDPLTVSDEHVSRLRHLLFDVQQASKAALRSLIRGRDLHSVMLRPGLATAGIVAVVAVKDEAPRLEFLFRYYRRLGVGHFVLVDNRSTDGVRDLVRDESDISVVAAEGSYSGSRFGNDWVNTLLRRHCVGKWILYVDADEFLVFSERSNADLRDLVAELDGRGQRSLQTVMVDMYSRDDPLHNVVAPGTDPLAVCNLYDRSGYVRHLDRESGTTWVKGGVRQRLFFDGVWTGPALNKSPLVKWRGHYFFLKSTHQLWPRHLNGRGKVEGALLHFKFTATSANKMADDELRKEHTTEYDSYAVLAEKTFVDAATARYCGVHCLVEDGIVEPIL